MRVAKVDPRTTTLHVWFPDGEQRSFQVAYLRDEAEPHPRLAFRGFTRADSVELPATWE